MYHSHSFLIQWGIRMMNDDSKVTSFSSITLLLLKELRLERNLHQAQLAEICDKTPSSWTKIETGKSPLSMEIFFRACNGLSVTPSAVLATAERYATLLSQNGWGVMSKQLEFNEDFLLKEAQEYYSTLGFRSRSPQVAWNQNVSVLSGPIYNMNGTVTLNDVFWFVLDKEFKERQINYKSYM